MWSCSAAHLLFSRFLCSSTNYNRSGCHRLLYLWLFSLGPHQYIDIYPLSALPSGAYHLCACLWVTRGNKPRFRSALLCYWLFFGMFELILTWIALKDINIVPAVVLIFKHTRLLPVTFVSSLFLSFWLQGGFWYFFSLTLIIFTIAQLQVQEPFKSEVTRKTTFNVTYFILFLIFLF